MPSLSPLKRALVSAITHPPQLINCEICGGTRIQIRTDPSPRIGSRCLSCRGTAHHRGTFAVLRSLYGAKLDGLRGRAVYEISAHGALYKALRQYSREIGFSFMCSELSTPGVRSENVEALSFPDASFDLITSTGLMEHVEHDEVAYREIARVLRHGGHYVFTVPYHEGSGTIIRARRKSDGSIENLCEPEYHSDPWHPGGIFTWRNYGPDIVQTMERAGLRARVEHVRVSGLNSTMPVIVGHAA